MIYKRDLLDAINGLNHDLLVLSIKVGDLETEIEKLKSKPCKCKAGKNTPAASKSKSDKAKIQTRDKSGKFVKEK